MNIKAIILSSILMFGSVEHNDAIQNYTQQDDIAKEFDVITWNIKIHSDDKYLVTGIKHPENIWRLKHGGFKIEEKNDVLYIITWQ